MSDRYERDKDGNVTGKVAAPHPATEQEPSPANNARPPDVPTFNTTLAQRAKGERGQPVPRPATAAHNSTLAERARAAKQRGQKAVRADEEAVEDKAVSRAGTATKGRRA